MPTPAPSATSLPSPAPSATAPPSPPEVAFFLSASLDQTPPPDGSGVRGGVLRSVDGGSTWELALPFFASLFFHDALEGWAAGDGALFRTRDGGRTWSSELARVPLHRPGLGPIDFADRRLGILLAATPVPDAFEDTISFLRTEDGGDTWSVAHQDSCRRAGADLCLTEGGSAVALLCDPRAALRSEDAGATWVETSLPAPLTFSATLSCAGESDVWVVEPPRAWHSPDGGSTWRELALPDDRFRTTDVAFLDPDRGWAVGFRDRTGDTVVARTVDGGSTWEEQLGTADVGLSPRVRFADAEHGMVVTAKTIPSSFGPPIRRPVVLVTEDGGATWLRRDLEDTPEQPFYAFPGSIGLPGARVDPVDPPAPVAGPNALLAARESGLFRSLDGGLTWTQTLHTPAGQQLYGVELLDRELAFAVGDSGVILKSTDGGVTWSSRHATGSVEPYRRSRLVTVRFFDGKRGVIGGQQNPNFVDISESPAMLFTEDGGDTWRPAAIAGLGEERYGTFPRSVCTRPSGLGLAGDQYSVRYASVDLYAGLIARLVLLTHDFGATWTNVGEEIDAPENFVIRSVACPSDAELWLLGGLQDVGNRPAVPYALRSIDGGATWAEIAVPLPAEMSLGRSVFEAAFLGPASGWLTAGPIQDHLALLATEDGGATWTELLFSEEPVFNNVRVERLDARGALVAASEGVRGLRQQPRILVTEDGGTSWASVAFPDVPESRGVLDLAATP